MAHTFTSLLTHLIFSTKNRTPFLYPDSKPRLFDYMGGIIRNLNGTSLLINGPEDHVHILALLPTTLALSDFAWQTGYGAFSVSKSNLGAVRAYIANQEEYHKRISFHDEYLEFLTRHEIDYDPRFVFD